MRRRSWLWMTTLLACLPALHAAQAAETMALVLGVKGSPFYEALACGARAEAKARDITLQVSAPDQFAADAQVPVIDAVAATKPTVAAIVPTDMQALVEPMRKLAQRGTKLVTVDQTIRNPSFIETQILTDNEAGGGLAANEMARLLGGSGKVLVITQPPGSAAQDARVTGFETKIKAAKGIDYLGPQYQSDDPQKAAEIVTGTLSAHPDLAGIFATNDQGAIGAITGLRQAGALGRVKLVAYDAASAEVSALKNGAISALIAQDPKAEGEAAVRVAQALAAGKPVDKLTMVPIAVIREGDTALADRYEYRGDCGS